MKLRHIIIAAAIAFSGYSANAQAPSVQAEIGPIADILLVLEANCKNGNMSACNDAGTFYGAGRGVKKSTYKAQELYTKSCFGGEGGGCRNLGLMYTNKKEIGEKPEQARGFMKKGCELRDQESCANFATFLRAGYGGDADLPKSRALSEQACAANIAYACDNFGILALNGQSGDKDESGAFAAFDKGCSASFPQSCNNLAVMYAKGITVPKDVGKSIDLMSRSCKLNYANGCKNYVIFSAEEGRKINAKGFSANQLRVIGEETAARGRGPQSVTLFQTACDRGSGRSCYFVGLAQLNGLHGVKKSRAKASASFEKGCNKEDNLACLNFIQMRDGKL